MSNPYIKDIYRNTEDSHQTAPGYVLTFLRWDNRDTKNYEGDPQKVRPPLIVINDATSVTVSNSKSSMSASANIVLKGGDINYATAIHPGDFLFVNMLNWDKDVLRVYNQAASLQAINNYNDGFKGLFKVMNVAKSLVVDPGSGAKMLTYTIQAAGFTEFNNVITYNPAIAEALKDKGAVSLYSSLIGDFYQDLLKQNVSVNTIVKSLFKILIGKSRKSNDVKINNFGNTHFQVPAQVGQLLGRKNNISYATDIYNYMVGIWGGSSSGKSVGEGFNPGFQSDKEEANGNFLDSAPIQGDKQIFVENWNNATSWSIINQNINNALNEIYTTYRVGLDGRVYPTIVVRQKPFTTEHFKGASPTTKFMSVPRWRVSADILIGLQTSKNDAARFNFVQVYTYSVPNTQGNDMALQIEQGNIVTDDGDIRRNGLRPYIMTSNFDFGREKNLLRGVPWTKIVADWIIDGHLKESGRMVFAGIQDPISIGDNLEFDSIVYQIEAISHQITVSPDGRRQFRTTVDVSYGMDVRSNATRPYYANMDHTDAHSAKQEDYKNENILPGIGEAQDIPGRDFGEETNETKDKSFTPNSSQKTRRTKHSSNNKREYVKPKENDTGRAKSSGGFKNSLTQLKTTDT